MFQLIDRAMRCFLFILILSLPYVHASNTGQLTGCLSCHEGIADFSEGPMTLAITAMSKTFDKQGCTVCHGGDPTAKDKEKAHYICTKSKILKGQNVPTLLASRICSKIK